MAETPSVSRGFLRRRERVAVYIDGFNMYHALDDLKKPHYKWLNLNALAELLISRKSQRIVKVTYFTAAPRIRTDGEQIVGRPPLQELDAGPHPTPNPLKNWSE